MNNLQNSLHCYVLMPFTEKLRFVYEYGIKPIFEEMNIIPLRADEHLDLGSNKLDEIKRQIKNSDLILIDLTEFNTNVVWELGYCQALEKHIIPISQPYDRLPFNFSGTDVIEYQFSPDGLEKLKDAFRKKLAREIEPVKTYRRSLRFDSKIVPIVNDIKHGLTQIPENSILRNLAKNEMLRLNSRINSLKQGTFQLRNEKPNKEIITYFCDYISQLNNENCRFDTVTFIDFWNEITEGTKNWDYLQQNMDAASQGVEINRVFIVDDPDETEKIYDENLRNILKRLFQYTQEHKDKMKLHIMFSNNYQADCETYRNHGLMKKDNEWLLFRPVYENGQMRHTEFYYFDEQTNKHRNNKTEIEKFQRQFEIVKRKSVELNENHFK